jgi:CheY-like chemotaxis protein
MGSAATSRVILCVDDEPAILAMLQAVLTDGGYTFELAKNGQEAIDTLQASPMVPRIMLLDLQMPIVDGWGVVRWLVEHPDIKAVTKIVLMSANERLRTASDLEHDGELAKPFGVDTLLALFDRLA